jgi:hypothetical protein
MAIKLYCEKLLKEGDKFLPKLQELMEKAMEQMRKEHYSTFYKHLLICGLIDFRPELL